MWSVRFIVAILCLGIGNTLDPDVRSIVFEHTGFQRPFKSPKHPLNFYHSGYRIICPGLIRNVDNRFGFDMSFPAFTGLQRTLRVHFGKLGRGDPTVINPKCHTMFHLEHFSFTGASFRPLHPRRVSLFRKCIRTIYFRLSLF